MRTPTNRTKESHQQQQHQHQHHHPRRRISLLVGLAVYNVCLTLIHLMSSTEMSRQMRNGDFQSPSFMAVNCINHTSSTTSSMTTPMTINCDNPNSERTLTRQDMAQEKRIRLPVDPNTVLPIDWTLSDSNNVQLDLGVPVAGQDDKLIPFVTHLGTAMNIFRQHVMGTYVVRLLITRYPQDDQSETWRQSLLHSSHVDSVEFVMVEDTQFHRAVATNALHQQACQRTDCVLSIIDVDLTVGPGFLRNALAMVRPGIMYFPIVFSPYRPSSVALVERFLGPIPDFHEQKGRWIRMGYGMYAMSGADVLNLTMDTEKFKGWGGEDTNFYQRAVNQTMTIIRQQEYHLVHRWHPKICQVGQTVNWNWYENWYV